MLTLDCMEKIAISSAKGGVGKTSFTLMLSQYLKNNGLKIGILDADIYGPNILANRDHKISSTDSKAKLLPIYQGGIEVSSISLIINDSEAAIWRGPMLSQAIKALHDNTNWSDLDYLLIDMPPGTGDAYLTVFQSLDVKKSLLVTTNDKYALYDNFKTISLFKKLSIELCGIIENMSEDFSLDEKPIHNSELAKYLSSSVLASLPLTKRAIIHEETLKLDRLEKYFTKELLKL